MDIDKLVAMANRIGDFFEAMPDADEARTGVADHLRRFWDPRMRRAIVAHVQNGGAGLHAIVREAIERNRERLLPAQS
jgi:formate dehydrogenase subunit delta